MPKSYIVKTLGCKANLSDGLALESELIESGWEPFYENQAETSAQEPELCIVNSCSVTDEADRQSEKLATRLARDYPRAKIVFTGCGAEIDPERFAKTPGVHFVAGNQDKPALVKQILDKIDQAALSSSSGSIPQPAGPAEILGSVRPYESFLSRHPMDREWSSGDEAFSLPAGSRSPGLAGRTRAFLKVQEGCNSFCTFCIIPYGRGPSRNLSIDGVVQQIQLLLEEGYCEVVLTGTNLGDFGRTESQPPQLVELVEAILKKTKLQRLRLSSLDPVEIEPRLVDLALQNPRICPHFHVSLQSPHSRVLKAMKRGYGYEEVQSCLERIHKLSQAPDAQPGGPYVGMDLIAGFPGETRDEFEWGLEALRRLPWTRLHVFPYSERSGTPATRIPGAVPWQERVRRAKALRELSWERLQSHYQGVLEACKRSQTPLEGVLLERGSGGYTPNYLRVTGSTPINLSSHWPNQMIRAMPSHLVLDRASGEVALWCEFGSKDARN